MISNKISINSIVKLRNKTGAGFADCKNALINSSGDIDKAIIFLRKLGAKILSNRSVNNSNEGCIFIKINNKKDIGIILSLNCETDFVAKNRNFIKLGECISDIALSNLPKKLDKLLNIKFNNLSVNDMILDHISTLGEKIFISKYNMMTNHNIISYIHSNKKIGVMLSFNKSFKEIEVIGKNIAMQIAAMQPIAIDIKDININIINNEIDIINNQFDNKHISEVVKNNIIKGKLKKFYENNVLLEQPFIKDNKILIKDLIKSIDRNLLINDFLLYKI